MTATHAYIVKRVSIHALLAECDFRVPVFCRPVPGFNPRTPCGVRPGESGVQIHAMLFQSTHSLRSATFTYRLFIGWTRVSIHALLAECDYVGKTG